MSEKNSPPAENSRSAPAGDSHVREAMERKNRIDKATKEQRRHLDPTRYGDWEKNGRCIDF